MITEYTKDLTKEQFLYLRKKFRTQLKEINERIKFLKAHRKLKAAEELYEKKPKDPIFSLCFPHFLDYHEPHNFIWRAAKELGQEARTLHIYLGFLNGTPYEKMEPVLDLDNEKNKVSYRYKNTEDKYLDFFKSEKREVIIFLSGKQEWEMKGEVA